MTTSNVEGLDADALARFAQTQRWWGAHDREMSAATVLESVAVVPGVAWVLLAVEFGVGEAVTYQLIVDEATGADACERPEVLRWLFPSLEIGRVALLGGEQSNTSLVIDDDVIVKLFRRLDEPGTTNPDVEVVRGLWTHGYRSIAEPLAECVRDGRELAVARRFLRRASSGWEMALDDPYFMDEVGDLGRVTAQLHVVMAEAFGAAPGDGAEWASAMRVHAERVPLPDGLDPSARFDALAGLDDVGAAIRIHGDYHLGQVLHWHGDWYLLDFEGEPARPMAERRAASSPLRDVAGMLRSFGYAVAVGALPPIWEVEARRRFLRGYRSVPALGPLLPVDVDAVLDAFELDKAVYEVGYERASRPDWEHIPLAAVRRLLA